MASRVLLATPGKHGSVWDAFSAKLLRHNGHRKPLQDLAIDISAAYTKELSDNLGNARVLSDMFQVIQNVVEAGGQVRKAEIWVNAGNRDQLERTRWMLLTEQVNWTGKENLRWETMALEQGVTGMAYEIRLVLQSIFDRKDAEEASKRFRTWYRWVHAIQGQGGKLLEPMEQAVRMVEGQFEGILANWTRGLTTNFMKGLNSLVSAMKHTARAYRTVEYMTAKLYFVAGKLTSPY